MSNRHRSRPKTRAPLAALRWLMATGILLAPFGCKAPGFDPTLGPVVLRVVNYSEVEGCPLEELYLHDDKEAFGDATDYIDIPVPIGEASDIYLGDQYIGHVTVIRCQRPLPGSPQVALTTALPVQLYAGRYELWVFDESFRLSEPVASVDASDASDASPQ